MIRVLIADDHAVLREGIKRVIEDTGEFTVVGEAGDGEQLLALAVPDRCDVVVMDLAMPGRSGLDVLRDLRTTYPKLPVLVLSMYSEDQYAIRTLQAGASGYINKGSDPGDLVQAIKTVASGQRYVSNQVAQQLAAHVDEVSYRPPHEKLSHREHQVLRMVASGLSLTEIARDLSLSVKTVSTFRSRILEKLDLHTTADIIRYAIENGLVD